MSMLVSEIGSSYKLTFSRVIFWNGIEKDNAYGILRTLTILMRM